MSCWRLNIWFYGEAAHDSHHWMLSGKHRADAIRTQDTHACTHTKLRSSPSDCEVPTEQNQPNWQWPSAKSCLIAFESCQTTGWLASSPQSTQLKRKQVFFNRLKLDIIHPKSSSGYSVLTQKLQIHIALVNGCSARRRIFMWSKCWRCVLCGNVDIRLCV